MSLIDQLKGFRALQDFSLQQVAALAARGKERSAGPGDLLFAEQEEAKEILFLLKGQLAVKSRGKHLSDIYPLSLAGEMGVLGNEVRSASVLAVGPCEFLSLEKEDFLRLIAEDPDLGMKFYRNLCAILVGRLKDNNLFVEFIQSVT